MGEGGIVIFHILYLLVTGEDGTPRLPASGLTEEERLVEEGKSVTLK